MKYVGSWNKKLPKLKKGAWFVPVRGSYLPMTPQGWIMHFFLLIGAVAIIADAYYDTRSVPVIIISMLLELVGLGSVFTYLAAKKS